MCGIIGYWGKGNARQVLLEGLHRLEYRGYDSAGVTLADEKNFFTVRAKGRIEALEAKLEAVNFNGAWGIGHTRWATHGKVSEENAHPQNSSDGRFSLVHNGVIENFQPLRDFLQKEGFTFSSETDSEVIVNLIAYHYRKEALQSGKNRFCESVRKALLHLRGTYGIVVLCRDYPEEMIGARNSSPLILGIGHEEFFLCSDVSGFAAHTQDVVFLRDQEMIHIQGGHFTLLNLGQEKLQVQREQIEWNEAEAGLQNFPHYMLKEIFEQPQALENALRGRFSADGNTAHFGGLKMTPRELRQVERIVLCGCGTAWHACLVGEYLIEELARIPVEVEYASEFRYRNSPLERNTLIIVVSQSGETVDTLEAMKEAQRKGFRVMSICNVVGSTIAREADGGIYQHSGPEIGVASTKAFTSQLCILTLLALYLGRLRDMSHERGVEIVNALKDLPEKVQETLQLNDSIRELSERYSQFHDMLFLGRQSLFPIALEGALKIKEVAYIHAEGYPAAEMKHGPIALISPQCPAFFLGCSERIFEKTLANIHEVQARGAPIIAILQRGQEDQLAHITKDCLLIPPCHDLLTPILASIPLQLFAYHTAVLRGCDVDKPRNLAKSVTVE